MSKARTWTERKDVVERNFILKVIRPRSKVPADVSQDLYKNSDIVNFHHSEFGRPPSQEEMGYQTDPTRIGSGPIRSDPIRSDPGRPGSDQGRPRLSLPSAQSAAVTNGGAASAGYADSQTKT